MIDFEYQVIKTKRKSIEMSLHPDGMVRVRCPETTTDEYIKEFIGRKADMIRSHLSRRPQTARAERAVLTAADVARLKREAKEDMQIRTARFSTIMGVMPDDIQITSAHKRWACCIRRGTHHRICFSYRVMMLPEELRDFIVIHELAHITEIRHTPAFFALLGKYEPNHYYLADLVKRHEALIPYYAK